MDEEVTTVADCAICMGHLKALELPPAASWGEIRQTYLQLVKAWHPDRVADDGLRSRAEERFKEVQVAYRSLQEHKAQHTVAQVPGRGRHASEAEAIDQPFVAAMKKLLVRYADRHKLIYGDVRRIFVSPNIGDDVLRETKVDQEFRLTEILAIIRAGGVKVPWQTFLVLGTNRALIHAPGGFERQVISYERLLRTELKVRRHGSPPTLLGKWTKKVGLSEPNFGEALELRDGDSGRSAVLYENFNGDPRITKSLVDLIAEVKCLAEPPSRKRA